MEAFPGEVHCRADTLSRINTALEKGGVEFLTQDDQTGVRLRKAAGHHG
jgi:hypothetical protein